MKIKKSIIVVLILIVAVVWYVEHKFYAPSSTQNAGKDVYYCPMHPTFTSTNPSTLCSICGMSLVKRQSPTNPTVAQENKSDGRKILYYRNPMDPKVTSPVPAKDSMGMDYIPVYEEPKSTVGRVEINPAKQQLIGVKTQKVEKREMTGQILTVGIVAYDPDLFVAQQEYLQSLQTRKTMESGNLKYSDEQLNPIVNAAKRKLLLLGMSDAEIKQLEQSGKPEQYLYLPEGDKVWVYITIYEYEMDLVKENQDVHIETRAYPGEIFKGKVIAIAPIIDKNTRTLKVRAMVDDPQKKLRPQMYVDVKINYNLGEKLAVSQDAIMDSGTKKIVYIAEPNGFFQPQQVELGQKASGYYEILKGLSENQLVVTSGNFLIDSESKLNTVLGQMSEQGHE